MQKGIFIETVLIRANGGVITDESSILRADIRAYASAALNYSIMQGYYTGIKTEGNRDLSSLFYGYFPQLAISKDTQRNNTAYIVPPKGTIALPSNQGIRFITDDCENTFKPLPDNAMHNLNFYLKLMPGTQFFRLTPGKIYLYNIGKLLGKVNLTMIVRFEDLAMTDELPIPAGLEDQTIELCVQFVTGQRQLPADRKNDERDLN